MLFGGVRARDDGLKFFTKLRPDVVDPAVAKITGV